MTWVRLDEDFNHHPKVLGLSNEAHRLHLDGLFHCNRFLTDGFISELIVQQLAAPILAHAERRLFALVALPTVQADAADVLAVLPGWRNLVDELVGVGVWLYDAETESFRIHDYLDYQPSRADSKALAETRAVSGRLGGLAKAKQLASGPLATGLAKTCPGPGPGSLPSLLPPSSLLPENLSSLKHGSSLRSDARVEVLSPKAAREHLLRETFAEFWKHYPRRDGRGAAFKKWSALSDPDIRAALDAVVTFGQIWSACAPEQMTMKPLPTTWLNQRRWEDDPKAWLVMAAGKNPVEQKRIASAIKSAERAAVRSDHAAFIADLYKQAGVTPEEDPS